MYRSRKCRPQTGQVAKVYGSRKGKLRKDQHPFVPRRTFAPGKTRDYPFILVLLKNEIVEASLDCCPAEFIINHTKRVLIKSSACAVKPSRSELTINLRRVVRPEAGQLGLVPTRPLSQLGLGSTRPGQLGLFIFLMVNRDITYVPNKKFDRYDLEYARYINNIKCERNYT